MILNLMTINLHCREEKDIKTKQHIIVDEIINKDIDVVFLQEVAQLADQEVIVDKIKKTNYGYELYELLKEKGCDYHYVYDPIKFSFNKYDEGLGLLSKFPLHDVQSNYISKSKDYQNWRSRKYLKATINIKDLSLDLFTSHLGWDSRVESYLDQCKLMMQNITNEHTLLGGDFNIACGSDYYLKTLEYGVFDLYGLDETKKYDFTFENDLDVHKGSARIDYIFGNKKYNVLEQEIIFKNPMVSDHYGMYMKIEV